MHAVEPFKGFYCDETHVQNVCWLFLIEQRYHQIGDVINV